jgi:hypothetical protein
MIFGAVESEPWGGYLVSFSGEDATRVATLDDLSALALSRAGSNRETVTLLCLDVDAFVRSAIAEGRLLTAATPGDAGVATFNVGARVKVKNAGAFLPRKVLDRVTGGVSELSSAKDTAGYALVSAGGISPGGSLSADFAALAKSMSKGWGYPEDGPMTQAAREAIHGGLCEVWQGSAMVATHDGELPPDAWLIADDVTRLPPGVRLYDEDRSSAYAAEGMLDLPATHTDCYADPDAAFGGIVHATVNLDSWTGVAFPAVVRQGGSATTRQITATAGAWRGHWATPLIQYAQAHGAQVEVHDAWCWREGAPYLAPFMGSIYERKQASKPGSVARDVYTAALQRVVGYMGRRARTETFVAEADFRAALDSGEHSATAYAGPFAGAYLVRGEAAPDPKYIFNPVWTAIIVARTWVSICRRVEEIRAMGGEPYYADTDGLLFSAPGTYVAKVDADKAGDWTLRGLPAWSWCEGRKVYARGIGAEILESATAGIPQRELIDYISGGFPPERTETLREQITRGAMGPPKQVPAWNRRKRRA